ncbi:alpha/beta hydrolase [Roseivirga pacifica]|uniref:alpha/beta hydrolase n=1 Tax=Roseivirga pacifica TaxID=1267423 RepID=UPI003BB0769B
MILRKAVFLLLVCAGVNVLSGQETKSTASQNVHIVEKEFDIPGLERNRQIRVYLPPEYEGSAKSYPVLYMHDGQNLFDNATSFVGEWGVDEILDSLYYSAGLELIVVGVDNGGANRIHELTAWNHEKYGKAEGQAYMSFIVSTIKPYVDEHYRTKPGRSNTAIMGSSLGGLITHYAVFQYPEVFSKAGILSPSYWWGEGPFEQVQEQALPNNTRLYLLMGGKEGDEMLSSFNRMVDLMKAQGLSKNVTSKVNPEGEHNEQFWNTEFATAVMWLFRD